MFANQRPPTSILTGNPYFLKQHTAQGRGKVATSGFGGGGSFIEGISALHFGVSRYLSRFELGERCPECFIVLKVGSDVFGFEAAAYKHRDVVHNRLTEVVSHNRLCIIPGVVYAIPDITLVKVEELL